MRVALTLVLGIAVGLTAATPARADSQAEALKQQGVKAAKDGDWELARTRFEESYAIDPRPLTLYNLASAQERTNQLVAARASYARFVTTSAKADNPRFYNLAVAAIAKLDRDIPTLHIRLAGVSPGEVAVELDARELAAAELEAPIAVDPGDHTIAVLRDRVAVARRTVQLGRGGREDVDLVLPPRVVIPPPPIVTRVERPPLPPPPAKRSRSVLASGWFWGITAAVVLGGAAGAGYYFYGREPDPVPGTLGGVIQVP